MRQVVLNFGSDRPRVPSDSQRQGKAGQDSNWPGQGRVWDTKEVVPVRVCNSVVTAHAGDSQPKKTVVDNETGVEKNGGKMFPAAC